MTYRSIILLFLTSIIINNCFSQETRTVYGDYTYYASESTSIEEAKRIALDRAKIQAIADEFGTNISQSATTTISTQNEKSETQFFFIGVSDIKGEWIETFGSPVYSVQFEPPIISVNCKVKGKIREILQPEIELEAKTLKNGMTIAYESSDFKDGDDLYLHFKSSSSGNIVVFLVQSETVYRLLPYKRDNIKEYSIEGGKDYVFFSKSTEGKNNGNIDEYELFADKDIDSANILILFTPNVIGATTAVTDVYDEPLSMDFDIFNKWLIKKRNRDKFSRVIILPLTIKKA